MIRILEQFTGLIWHVVIVLGFIVCILNFMRTKNIGWVIGAIGTLLIEIGLQVRIHGSGYGISSGTWQLSKDTSILTYLSYHLPTFGIIVILIAAYLVGKQNDI